MTVVLESVYSDQFAAVQPSGVEPKDEQIVDNTADGFRPRFHLTLIALVSIWTYAGYLLIPFRDFRESHPLLTIVISPFPLFKFESVVSVPLWQFLPVCLLRGNISDYSAYKLGKHYSSWRHMSLPRIPFVTPVINACKHVIRWLKKKNIFWGVYMAISIVSTTLCIVSETLRVALTPVAFMFNIVNVIIFYAFSHHRELCQRLWSKFSWIRTNKEQSYLAGRLGISGTKVACSALIGTVLFGVLPYYGFCVAS